MPTKQTQQPSFNDINFADLPGVTKEQIEDVITDLKLIEKNAKAAKEYAKAVKAVKSAIPDMDKPTRINIADLAVMECTTNTRKKYEVSGGKTYRKVITFPNGE